MTMAYPALVRYYHPDYDRVRLGALVDGNIYDLNPFYLSPTEWLHASKGRADRMVNYLASLPTGTSYPYPIAEFQNPPIAALDTEPLPKHLIAPVDNQTVWVNYTNADEQAGFAFKTLGKYSRGNYGQLTFHPNGAQHVVKPMLGVVVNPERRAIGFTIGSHVFSPSLLEVNPHNLSGALSYQHSCGVGSGLAIVGYAEDWPEASIQLTITRKQKIVYEATATTSDIPYQLGDYIDMFAAGMDVTDGVIVLTDVGVTSEPLEAGDVITIIIDGLGQLINTIA